ncbi:alpha/beta fold hydrolase [Streptomyces sp. NPDC040750]|uniref:thioesterase II family protein n=1 Tax=Streptomyces sp. NPDC040750 TaxID=3154491 RepID=UPI0033D5D49B
MNSGASPTRSASWILGRVTVTRPHLRLICIPQAGAGSGSFRAWRHRMPSGIELAPVELPGRGTRADDALPQTLEELAEQLWTGLADELKLPYVLFGHSLGGLLAYQLTSLLEERGGPAPLATVVATARAPHRPSDGAIHTAGDAELLRWLAGHDALPRELFDHPDFLRQVLSVLRRDLALAVSYVVAPPVPLHTPLHVLGGVEDPVVPTAELHHWSACAAGEFSLTPLPGSHGFPQRDPAAVLDALGRALPEYFRPDDEHKVNR